MWPIVTSCETADCRWGCGARCLAACLPQSTWHSGGMTGHSMPFPLLCWRAGRNREKLRIACQDRKSWVAIWPRELVLTHENSCDLDSLGTGHGSLSAVHYWCRCTAVRNSVLKFSCVLCVRILLLFVVVCSVRAVPRFDCRRGTHTERLAHNDRWEVIRFHWACTRIFSLQG